MFTAAKTLQYKGMVEVFRYCLASLMVAFSALAGARAQDGAMAEITPQSVEAWADKAIGGVFDEGRITGAVVSVVKDGAVIFEKGYGYDDVTTKAPASAMTTRVRIGSTTKTFTATIIAQLMEEGAIGSLDDPANKYLKRYNLPDNDGVEITLRHLLTHTAGFEDKFFFIGSDRRVDIPVSAELFDTLRPRFVRPAGEKIVYSNFGVAVLGLVIEDLTGMAIDDAFKARLFGPLGMADTDLAVSIDEPAGLARPGDINAAGEIAGPTRFTAINPAVAQTGSIVSTAADMARFMNAQLGFGDALSAEVRRNLHTRARENAPEINGLGMVFFVDRWAGEKTVSHGGNWAGFHTWMTLLPDEGVGFYVTLLGDATPQGLGDMIIGAVAPDRAAPSSPAMLSASATANGFLSAFYGPKRGAPAIDTPSMDGLSRYAGLYRGDRRPFTFAEEISSLVYFGPGLLKVEAGDDGLYLGGAGPWVPVGGGRFVLDAGSRPLMVIEPNARTGVLTLSPEIGIYTFSKIAQWASPRLHSILIYLLLPLTLIGLSAPFVIGRNAAAIAPFVAGIAGAILIGAALIGVPEGGSMMIGYYAGHLTRITVFVIAANLLAAASLGACLKAALDRKARLRILLLISPALAASIILAQYNALGFRLI
ncbi:MAG: serine hydrolase domain-containing protein [Parvularculaceae bacterium]